MLNPKLSKLSLIDQANIIVIMSLKEILYRILLSNNLQG